MYVVAFRMRSAINQDPGLEGKIPLYSMLPRMSQYEIIARYRALRGKDSVYRAMQVGWGLFGIGIAALVGGKLFDSFMHR